MSPKIKPKASKGKAVKNPSKAEVAQASSSSSSSSESKVPDHEYQNRSFLYSLFFFFIDGFEPCRQYKPEEAPCC
jgi:hypothetical protein